MRQLPFSIDDRSQLYVESRTLAIESRLGFGQDGYVYSTSNKTAIKCLRSEELYRREVAVYRHLQDRKVKIVKEFHVPELIDYDDGLLVIEMTIVTPPYVLDFASAFLRPCMDHYSQEDMDEWRKEKQEQFEDDWPKVRLLMAAFEGLGVYLSDIHPRNVACHEQGS